MQRRARDRWTVSITDPSMVAIRNMVVRGNVSQATNKLNSTYRFDHESGLIALRQFSIIVLQRGLKERDPFEQCYAASALAEGGENQALQMLANTFQTDPDLSLKMAVADGLGEVGDRKAVAILGHLYYHGEMLDRRFIVNALSSATDPSAIVILSDAARQSSDPALAAGRAQRPWAGRQSRSYTAAEAGVGQGTNHGAGDGGGSAFAAGRQLRGWNAARHAERPFRRQRTGDGRRCPGIRA